MWLGWSHGLDKGEQGKARGPGLDKCVLGKAFYTVKSKRKQGKACGHGVSKR